MPVLPDIANLLSVFNQYVISKDKLQLYELSYDSLLYSTLVHLGNLFSDFSLMTL